MQEERAADIQPRQLSPSTAPWQKALDHQRGHFSPVWIVLLQRLRWLCVGSCLKKTQMEAPLWTPRIKAHSMGQRLLKAPWVVPESGTLHRWAALRSLLKKQIAWAHPPEDSVDESRGWVRKSGFFNHLRRMLCSQPLKHWPPGLAPPLSRWRARD